jgi:hypothetical protein
VILADDALLVWEGLARLLTEQGFDIVAQVGDAGGIHSSEARATHAYYLDEPEDAVLHPGATGQRGRR